MHMRKDLGDLNDLQTIDQLVPVDGLNLIDIGCGAGANSRELVARGATVLGVEPDPIQAEKNRAAVEVTGLRFVETGATTLPVDDASVDGVFFFRSLHHVPIKDMDAALAEAARVLKPGTGFLYVVEPATTGSHFPVMRPYNDETVVRSEAQAALARAAKGLFPEPETFVHAVHPRYDDFDSLVSRVSGQSYNDIDLEKVETDEVRALFEAGKTDDGNYVFDQPMLVNLFRMP